MSPPVLTPSMRSAGAARGARNTAFTSFDPWGARRSDLWVCPAEGTPADAPSLTAAIRAHGLRPHCEPCQASKGRDTAVITHPAGEETQWDWVELPNPP